MGERSRPASPVNRLAECRPGWLRLRFIVVVGVVCLALPVGSRGQSMPIWWSPEIHLARLQDIPKRLSTPLAMPGYPAHMKGVDLTKVWAGRAEVHVSTCSEFIKAAGAGYFPGNNLDVRRASVFVDECYVLYYLERATPARQSFIPEGGWSREMFSLLPPLVEPSEAAKKAWAAGTSWQEFAPGLRVVRMTHDVVDAKEEANYYRVDALARADFNGDGNEELAVSTWIKANGGTLLDCRFFILTRVSEEGPMRIVLQRGED
jgi:hypothetical protein